MKHRQLSGEGHLGRGAIKTRRSRLLSAPSLLLSFSSRHSPAQSPALAPTAREGQRAASRAGAGPLQLRPAPAFPSPHMYARESPGADACPRTPRLAPIPQGRPPPQRASWALSLQGPVLLLPLLFSSPLGFTGTSIWVHTKAGTLHGFLSAQSYPVKMPHELCLDRLHLQLD